MAPVRILKATARRLHKISGLTFLVVGFLALGAAVRALRFGAPIAFAWARGDEPRPAILALNILHGIFPIHQLGYDYHGAPPAYAVAVVFALLGPTPLAFDLAAYGAGLAILVTGYFLGRRILAAPVALLALATLAVPPLFLSQWSLHGNLNQSVGVAMGNLMLLGTHTLFFRRPGDPRSALALGLVAGLGWWINPLAVVYFAPFALLAAWTGLWRKPAILLFPVGALLGGLPAWLYEVSAFPSSRFFVYQHGDTPTPPLQERLGAIVRDFLPRILGVESREATFSPHGLLALGILAFGAVVLVHAVLRDGRALIRCGGRAPRPTGTGILLWPVFLTNLALVLGTPRGIHGNHYLLPLYSVLFCWTGETLAWLWRTHRVVGMLVSGILLAFHLGSNWTASLGSTPPEMRRWRPLEARIAPLVSWLTAQETRTVYWVGSEPLSSIELTFLTGGRVVAADPWGEEATPESSWVDAALAPPWIMAGDHAGLQGGLRALGLAVSETRVGPFRILQTRPTGSMTLAPIPPDRWVVTASERPEEVGNLVDRDVGTAWSTGGPQVPGQWVAVDLGAEAVVARVDLLAIDRVEIPTAFRVEVARDGVQWQTVADIPEYWGPLQFSEHHAFLKVRRGRVQAMFPPVRARFVRLVQTGATTAHAWSARELFVYGPAEAAPVAPSPAPGVLAETLRRHRVGFVYANTWLSARVLAESRGAIDAQDGNIHTNAYGRLEPPPERLRRFRFGAGRAILLGSDADVDGTRATLEGQSVGWRESAIGPYRLLVFAGRTARPRRLSREGWRATATQHPEQAGLAIDGNPRTRWTSAAAPGAAAFALDLGGVRRASEVDVTPGLAGVPLVDLRLDGSQDGATWLPLGPSQWAGRVIWTGSELLRDGAQGWRVHFPATPLRYLRMSPTRAMQGRWTIDEVQVLG